MKMDMMGVVARASEFLDLRFFRRANEDRVNQVRIGEKLPYSHVGLTGFSVKPSKAYKTGESYFSNAFWLLKTFNKYLQSGQIVPYAFATSNHLIVPAYVLDTVTGGCDVLNRDLCRAMCNLGFLESYQEDGQLGWIYGVRVPNVPTAGEYLLIPMQVARGLCVPLPEVTTNVLWSKPFKQC